MLVLAAVRDKLDNNAVVENFGGVRDNVGMKVNADNPGADRDIADRHVEENGQAVGTDNLAGIGQVWARSEGHYTVLQKVRTGVDKVVEVEVVGGVVEVAQGDVVETVRKEQSAHVTASSCALGGRTA